MSITRGIALGGLRHDTPVKPNALAPSEPDSSQPGVWATPYYADGTRGAKVFCQPPVLLHGDDLVNRVRVVIHPRTVDASLDLAYRYEDYDDYGDYS